MAAALLVGPPEIYQHPITTTTTQIDTAAATTTTTAPFGTSITTITMGSAFIDLMVSDFNTEANKSPLMGLTENRSPTFLSTGNPCLDFFFHVVPDTPSETVNHRLQLAWDQDPLMALKLVCNLRGVRGTGKSDKEGFYTAALWLHEHHPKTLAGNVATLADFGYFKDLLEILFRVLEGAGARALAKQIGKQWNYNRKLQKHKQKRTKGEKPAKTATDLGVEKSQLKSVNGG